MARTGLKPGPFDGRDFSLALAHSSSLTATASKVVLPHPFGARDQLHVPCCVSCAIAVAMECLDHRTPPARQLSPLYHYWRARERDGKQDNLAHLTLRDGLQSAVDDGIAELKRHDPPFDRDGALTPPSSHADASARQRRLAMFDPITEAPAYFRVSGAGQWLESLRRRMPVVAGFWVTSSYRSITPANPVHGPIPPESSTVGHAVAVVGFDEASSAFLIKDSRGTEWGDRGMWWMPASIVDSSLIESAFALGRILETE